MKHFKQPMILRLRIWLWEFIKNGHFSTKNENSMTQRFFAGTIKPWKWLALTMSYDITKSQKKDKICVKCNVHLNNNNYYNNHDLGRSIEKTTSPWTLPIRELCWHSPSLAFLQSYMMSSIYMTKYCEYSSSSRVLCN